MTARLPRPTSPKTATLLVQRGWDRLTWTYRPRGRTADPFGHGAREYRAWVDLLSSRLRPGARVVELGSGTGEPATRALARRYRTLGVDLSPVMVRRARARVPTARFVQGDMTQVRFAPGSFDAVVSFYAMIHVPRRRQRTLVHRIAQWLRPGGYFLAIVGHRAFEGIEERWLDQRTPMYWSHPAAATFRRWLTECGFVVELQQFVAEGTSGHELFLARRSPND